MSETAQYTALELEVKGNKNSSGFQTLDDLTKALQRLKSVQPANVKALAESVKLLTDTAGALTAKDIIRLNDLSYALKRIASLGKMNTNAPQVIQSVADAANSLSNETLDKLTKLGEAFEKIAQMKGTKVKTALNAIGQPAVENPENKLPNTPSIVPGSEQEVEPAEIEEAGEAAETASKKLLTLGQALRVARNAFNDTVKVAKFFGNTFFSTLKNIGSVLKQAVFSKLTSRLNSLHSILKRIGRIAFLKTIRGAISAVVSAVKTGIDNLYQWSLLVDHTFANSMNQIATASMYMKNSIGAMLAPAIEALAPVIDFVIDRFVALLNIMNQVLALITGKSYWTKAIKQPQDFADAANSAGGAASDAAKAIKLYLGAFDELHVMDSPSGSGSGGGGGSGSGTDYGGMFENVAFDTTLQDAINNGDWFKVGETLALKLNDITAKADEWLTGTFTPWANTFATNLGNTINGFVKTYNWAQLGKTVGDGVNGIVSALNTFYTTTEWGTIGTNIGTAITNLFSTIKWNEIAQMFGNKFNVLIDTVHGLVKKIFAGNNAVTIGQTIADSIVTWFQTVHWDNLASAFETGFNGAVTAFSTFVKDPNVWTEFKKALKAFEKMDLDIAGLGSALSTVFTKALGTINWFEFGKKVGEFIGSIEWENVVPSILTAISESLSGFIDGLWNSGSGKTLIGMLAASFATALAVQIGVEVVKANILKTVIASAVGGAGAGAAAGAVAGAAGAVGETAVKTSIWTAVAEAIGGSVTALGVTLAVPVLATIAIAMSPKYDNPEAATNADKIAEIFEEKYGDPIQYISKFGDEAYKEKMMEIAKENLFSIDVKGNIVEINDDLSQREKTIPDMNGEMDKVTDKIKPSDKILPSFAGELTSVSDGGLDKSKPLTGFTAGITKGVDKINTKKTAKLLNGYEAEIIKGKDGINKKNKWLDYGANLYKDYNSIKYRWLDYGADLKKDYNSIKYRWLDYGADLKKGYDSIDPKEKKISGYSVDLYKSIDKIEDKTLYGYQANINNVSDGRTQAQKELNFTANITGLRATKFSAGITIQADGGIWSGGKWHAIESFAGGGQPTGQLFVAREAGPELVGTIGGHTAVMNNDQIVASVSDGVYRAMTQAMSSGNGNTQLHVYLDGKEIYNNVVDQNNQIYKRTGNSPLMV